MADEILRDIARQRMEMDFGRHPTERPPPSPAQAATAAPPETFSRRACVASWDAAKRRADVVGYATSTAASVAGQYLEVCGGDATRASSMLPQGASGPFWQRVRDALRAVQMEPT